MKMRRLGKTEYEISAIGFGGLPIQRVTEEEAIELIREAHKYGINFIDTARGYRDSEKLIGIALKEVGRENFIIASKSRARTYEGIKEQVGNSLKDLQVDHIDLYQIHNVKYMEDYELVMGEEGALRGLKELKEEGVIGEIGITSHTMEILDMAIDTGEFATIQYPYNAVETQGEDLFKKAKKHDMGVIVMKPLAGGAIYKGDLSLRYIMENDDVTVAIPGMDMIEQVKMNAEVGIKMEPLSRKEREGLDKETSELGKEFCRRCGYCLPCTVGIDIPSQFIMESYYLRYDLADWAIERYNLMESNAKDCIECGECETRCPYDLPIIDMLKRVESNLG